MMEAAIFAVGVCVGLFIAVGIITGFAITSSSRAERRALQAAADGKSLM